MYKMMGAQEIAKHMINNRVKYVDFTFDVMDGYRHVYTASGSPEGWHGIKVLNLFNCQTYTIAIGYYGGCTVKYHECPYFKDKDAEVRWLTKVIYSYFKDEDEFDSKGKKVCVEV